MAMDFANRSIKYQMRLFLIMSTFIWILTFTFFVIQFSREYEYKVGVLNNELQILNKQILYNLDNNKSTDYTLISSPFSQDSLRITILDLNGNVFYDSSNEGHIENHKSRKEIQSAISQGTGYTVRRLSKVSDCEYFYSATKGSKFIVRTALPYNNGLYKELEVNTIYLISFIIIALTLTVISFFATKRLGKSVNYLRDFANKAENGDLDKFSEVLLPNDELGEISKHITNLYQELQLTTKERDISIQNLLDEEKDKNRIKHQLTSNINHELKTPVHAIQACLETIKDNKETLDITTIYNLIDKSYDNVLRLCDLLSDISIITSMTDSSDSILKEEIEVLPIIQSIKEQVNLLPIEKQMRININVPDGLKIMANKNLFEAIFRNIINNALSYSGGRDIFITLLSQTSDYLKFSIKDNGIGVSEKHLDKLFERFYRIDDGRSRKIGGTGLGLSIVKNSVIFHGGKIIAKSPQNMGLEFIFTIKK